MRTNYGTHALPGSCRFGICIIMWG